jgi:uncharacterized membrane protein YphA (DoxX/SURF4 family)
MGKLPILLVAVVFIYAGLDKIFHYDGFVNALASYSVMPEGLAPLVAMPLILVEIFTGLGIFLKRWRRPALATAVTLLSVFTVALAINLYVAPGSVCGCWFTITIGKSTGFHVAQNLVWLAIAALGWWEEGQTAPAQLQSNKLVPTAEG